MAKKPLDQNIFMFIGGYSFTLEDLGPAADMKLPQAMQYIIDNGMLGEEHKGTPWYHLISSAGMNLEMEPTPDETLQYTLFQKYDAALDECRELNRQGLLTQAHKDNMEKLRKDWKAAEKLAKL